jgi:hypothetical protein
MTAAENYPAALTATVMARRRTAVCGRKAEIEMKAF